MAIAFCAFFNVENVTVPLRAHSKTVWRGKQGDQQVKHWKQREESVTVYTNLTVAVFRN